MLEFLYDAPKTKFGSAVAVAGDTKPPPPVVLTGQQEGSFIALLVWKVKGRGP